MKKQICIFPEKELYCYFSSIFPEVLQFISKEELNKYGIYAGSLGREVRFKTGDRILSINNQGFEKHKLAALAAAAR